MNQQYFKDISCMWISAMVQFIDVSNKRYLLLAPHLTSEPKTIRRCNYTMRKYELMYIIRPNIEEDAKKALVERFEEILTSNGAEIVEAKDWGKRRLAYEINDFREGFYQLVKVNAGTEAINEYTRLANISEDIIRFIAVREEEK